MKNYTIKTLILFFLLLIGKENVAQVTIVQPDSTVEGMRFGYSVDIYQDFLIVGAPWADFGAGEAYLFEKVNNNWIQTDKIENPEGNNTFDGFAHEVELEDNFAFIGYPNAEGGDGDVTILEHVNGSWTNLGEIGQADALGKFGWSIDADSNMLIVGASTDNNFSPPNSGSAYVYSYQNGVWTEEAKLEASDADTDDVFGSSVSINGDLCIIGAPGEDDFGFGNERGAAYIYDLSSQPFVEIVKLTASDGQNEDRFGEAVLILGNHAFVGAPGDINSGQVKGSVYVFENINGTWTETDKIIMSGNTGYDFGRKLYEFQGDIIASSFPANAPGKIHKISNSSGSWGIDFSYVPPQINTGDFYAHDIAMSQLYYVGGAWSRDLTGFDNGQVFLTERSAVSYIGSEIEHGYQFSLWPNPSSKEINISFSGEENRDFEIDIRDLHGRIVKTGNINTSANQNLKIDISDWDNGLYLIRFRDKNTSHSKTFIKQ